MVLRCEGGFVRPSMGDAYPGYYSLFFIMLNLSKGQSLDLTKEAGKPVTKVRIGAGWDVAVGKTMDLDIWAILRGEAPCYFNNLTGNGVKLDGDDRTGASSAGGADENMHIDAAAMTSDEVTVVVNIFQAAQKGQFFKDVASAFVEIVDEETGTKLGEFKITENGGDNSALVAGRLTRVNGALTFTAVGDFSTTDIEVLVKDNGGVV
jgi:tellurium resistance protein TerD